jgi:hypothetical protein
MAFHFQLNRLLSRSADADADDVLNVKRALSNLGFYDADYDIHEVPDAPLFDGIRRFQQRMSLEPDGWMAPGGETEQTRYRVLSGGQPDEQAEVPGPIPPTRPVPPRVPMTLYQRTLRPLGNRGLRD